MSRHRKLIIWTLISNFLIVFAAGHGGATLGLFEIFMFGSLISRTTNENFLLLISSMLTLIGQVALIFSFFCNPQLSFRLRIIGTLILIVGYFFLLVQFWTEPTIGISLITGIPFIMLAIILFFKSFATTEQKEI